jgi:predicted nucleotidyltransferase
VTNLVLASLRRLVVDLTSLGERWALVGGFAVSARAEPRFTRDVDVCLLAADDAAAESVVLALRDRGYEASTIVEQENTGRLATVRMLSPIESGVVVDLLFASSGVELEVIDGAEVVEVLPGLDLPVARAGHLVVLKLLSQDETRPQDSADLRALLSHLAAADRAEAVRLAHLIVRRGYHRERDLVGLTESYLASLDPSARG